jgi:hypothetical protein
MKHIKALKQLIDYVLEKAPFIYRLRMRDIAASANMLAPAQILTSRPDSHTCVQALGSAVTTVFVRHGKCAGFTNHFRFPKADITLERSRELGIL